jgi:light-regulated signal transduction histidine kinase (bacteriophytochrome)
VDLNEVVRNVLSDLEVQIENLHATVQVERLETIQADALQMRQLLQNLIGNALKFHRPDVTPAVHVAGARCNGGACYELTVADNGIGFDMQYAERIFQVFQRLHGRGEYEGTGVGLAICRKIVERHGGTISASSTPGEGAVFTVCLPANEKESG